MLQSSQTATLSEALQIQDLHFSFSTCGFFFLGPKIEQILFLFLNIIDPLLEKLFFKNSIRARA